MLHVVVPLRQRHPAEPRTAGLGGHPRQPVQGQAHDRLRVQPHPPSRLRRRSPSHLRAPRLLLQLRRRRRRDHRLGQADEEARLQRGRRRRQRAQRGEHQVPDKQRADVDERGADGPGYVHGRVRGRGGVPVKEGRVRPHGQRQEVHQQCAGARQQLRPKDRPVTVSLRRIM